MDNKKKSNSAISKVRKTLVRNVEVKVSKTPRTNEILVSKCGKSNENISDNKFAVPKINSTKKISKQIETIENMDPDLFITPNEADLIEINKKVGQKLNFHFDETVYKNLVALNIDDAASSRQKSKVSNRKAIVSANRDIEPNLDDFYEGKKEPDKPIMVSAVKVKLLPISRYDGKDLYYKFKSFKS